MRRTSRRIRRNSRRHLRRNSRSAAAYMVFGGMDNDPQTDWLVEVARVLAQHGITVSAAELSDYVSVSRGEEYVVLTLPKAAVETLRAHGFRCKREH